MSRSEPEIRWERDSLFLRISALQSTIRSLELNKLRDQVAYQQHIGELIEENRGKGYLVVVV